MKPLINIFELSDFVAYDKGDFKELNAIIGEKIGAKKLNYSFAIIPPGKKMCPFHNHRINEELFIIFEGQGVLRFGDKSYSLKPFDVIACPPGDQSVAHQIINTGSQDLKYFCLSTNEAVDICEYPDSNKILVVDKPHGFRHVFKACSAVDYFEGELDDS